VGWCNEYWWWFRSLLGKKRRVLHSSGPRYQDCWHTGLLHASLIGSKPSTAKRGRVPSRWTSRSMCKSSASSICETWIALARMNDQCKVSRFSRKKPDTSMAEVHETTSCSYVHTVILWNGSWRKTTPNNQTSEKKMSQTLIETRSQISKPTACLKSDYCPPQWQQLLWQSIFDFRYSYGLRWYKCCKYAIPKFSRHKACEHYSASQL